MGVTNTCAQKWPALINKLYIHYQQPASSFKRDSTGAPTDKAPSRDGSSTKHTQTTTVAPACIERRKRTVIITIRMLQNRIEKKNRNITKHNENRTTNQIHFELKKKKKVWSEKSTTMAKLIIIIVMTTFHENISTENAWHSLKYKL